MPNNCTWVRVSQQGGAHNCRCSIRTVALTGFRLGKWLFCHDDILIVRFQIRGPDPNPNPNRTITPTLPGKPLWLARWGLLPQFVRLVNSRTTSSVSWLIFRKCDDPTMTTVVPNLKTHLGDIATGVRLCSLLSVEGCISGDISIVSPSKPYYGLMP